MQLSKLKAEVDTLVAEGKGDLRIFIMDGHSGMPYEMNSTISVQSYDDDTADAELATSGLSDGDEFIQVGFG